MDYGPGSASFALVAWDQLRRVGRWSFWLRGTGEKMLQHHCRGTERSEPVDRTEKTGFIMLNCRGCGAAPNSEIRKLYWAKETWKR